MVTAAPFWKTKRLEEMTDAEWESLCDGCGRCCLHKLRDEATDVLLFTRVACRLLDLETGRCKDYAHRRSRVPGCVRLTPRRLKKIDWLPPTCAYRRLAEGLDLPPWHPLITGDPESVVRAGVSVAGRVITESKTIDLENHVVAWPGRMPTRRARRKEKVS